jgi:hypothetical protein
MNHVAFFANSCSGTFSLVVGIRRAKDIIFSIVKAETFVSVPKAFYKCAQDTQSGEGYRL